ncbi:MAG: serine/threonine protein kinase [Sumerlaeia bacterium]
MLSRFFEDSQLNDPELSIIPDGTRFPLLESQVESPETETANAKIPSIKERYEAAQQMLPRWRVASETNPIDRRGQNISATLQERYSVNYSLQNQLGVGGFGEVWEAVQTSMGRRIAIKRMKDQPPTKSKSKAHDTYHAMKVDFKKEALTTALLEHPNIIPVHDLGEDERGRPLLAMKLVRGKSWDELIKAEFNLPLSAFLQKHLSILLDVAQAVAFAHSKGIIHRDLKPSQVMVGEFGEVLLMDWGIAMIYDPTKIADEVRELGKDFAPTRENAVCPAGTPAYMAPEQTKRDATLLGPCTDTYLLGGILYFLLTKRAPHACGNAQEAFRHASKGEIIPAQEAAPSRGITNDLNDIANKALSPLEQDRFQSAQEFITAVQNYLSGETKKSEAQGILANVKDKLKEDAPGYDVLYECQNMLYRVLTLSPSMHEAMDLQIKITEQLARKALDNNDLVLCKLMLKNLTESETRSKFAVELEKKETQNRRDTNRRLILNIVIAVFIIVILVDLFILFQIYASK